MPAAVRSRSSPLAGDSGQGLIEGAVGERIRLTIGIDENEEAQRIAETCNKLIKDGTRPQNIAVLYRANFQSRALEEAFLFNGIPYKVLGTRFFERKEIK